MDAYQNAKLVVSPFGSSRFQIENMPLHLSASIEPVLALADSNNIVRTKFSARITASATSSSPRKHDDKHPGMSTRGQSPWQHKHTSLGSLLSPTKVGRTRSMFA